MLARQGIRWTSEVSFVRSRRVRDDHSLLFMHEVFVEPR